jgi:hypothetical protein
MRRAAREAPENWRRVRDVLLRTLTASTLVLVLAGCGEGTPPSPATPELGQILSEVDTALANRNYPRAEMALDELAAKALDAERAGEISGTEADRIVAAASNLRAQLPGGGDVDAPEDGNTSPAPVETSPPDDSSDGDDDNGEDEGED